MSDRSIEEIENSDLFKLILAAVTREYRRQASQDGLHRRILPPVPVKDDGTIGDTPVKVVDQQEQS